MRRDDICIYVSPADRARREGIVADRNSASKHVWRAKIVLATADGLGIKSKPCVWRWQERYIETGVDCLLRDKTRPSRKKPLSAEVKLKVLTTTVQPPPNATRWSTGLPMKKGRAATMTHDYKRNGTTTLFAALNVKTGEVIGKCLPRHRTKEFI